MQTQRKKQRQLWRMKRMERMFMNDSKIPERLAE